VQLPKLQVDGLLSPVRCEIEPRPIHLNKCPVCRAVLDLRDPAQMLAHVHDAEIEMCEGSGAPRPVALELKAKPTVNHPPTCGCYHVAKTRTGL
jgi:hypothetical protein